MVQAVISATSTKHFLCIFQTLYSIVSLLENIHMDYGCCRSRHIFFFISCSYREVQCSESSGKYQIPCILNNHYKSKRSNFVRCTPTHIVHHKRRKGHSKKSEISGQFRVKIPRGNVKIRTISH